MGFKLVQVGALRRESLQKWGLENITKNVAKKCWDLFKNGSKRGSQKSDRFEVFQGSIPAWSLGRPWGGSRAQKHVKMEARTWIFCYFGTMPSPSLETLRNISCVPWTTNWVRDVKFMVVFASAWGENLRWMLPRCLPDVSRFIQIHPDAFYWLLVSESGFF